MAIVNVKAIINADIKLVWDTVTSLDNYSWRSDLEKIHVLTEGKSFVEYAKGGHATNFNITKSEPQKIYSFKIYSDNIEGTWVGKFYSKEGKTIIDFTENVTTSNIFMKLFLKHYIKKQQAKYIKDLKSYLEK